MTPANPLEDDAPCAPAQWTVGHLRAELVGLPDDTPIVVDVPTSAGGIRRYPIIGVGYGEGVDPYEGIFTGQEFPLVAGPRPAAGDSNTAAHPAIADQGITPTADD